MRREDIRNIAIIAHVDHGKTTLVDCQMRQAVRAISRVPNSSRRAHPGLRTTRSVNAVSPSWPRTCAIRLQGNTKINIIDTPGHADFGGEVERVLRMADGAIVLVDAAEGPMPQTRFVLSKALECGLQPVVVVNKIDKPDARPHEVLDEAFELLMDLGAEDLIGDFPHLYASSKEGFATLDADVPGDSMEPLLDMILETVPGPETDEEVPLQMLVTTLDWSDYVGRIAIGRIQSGSIRAGQQIALMQGGLRDSNATVSEVHLFDKLGRAQVEEATAGDICALVGIDDVSIGDTVSDPEYRAALPRVEVDEPTIRMVFGVNTSPLCGREGKYVTTRNLAARLEKELERNVALRVEPLVGTDSFQVSGRGLLHLSILIETMRREGYELSVSKPRVIMHRNHGVLEEPFETLVVEVPHDKLGPVMELVGSRTWAVGRNDRPQRLHARRVYNSRPRTDRAANATAQRHAGHGDRASSFR